MLIHKDYQGSHFDYLGHSSVKEFTFGIQYIQKLYLIKKLTKILQ